MKISDQKRCIVFHSIFSFMCMLCRSLFVLLSFFLPLRSLSFDLRILTLLAVQQNHVAMGALVVQQNLVEMGVLVVHQNLVQMGCISRSTKSCSNGLHWSFNKILFKLVALVVQQNLVQMGCIGRSTKSC